MCPQCGGPKKRQHSARCNKCANADASAKAVTAFTQRRDEWIRRWMAGEIDGSHCSKIDRAGKAYPHGYAYIHLRERSGDACERCGWNTPHPISGRPPLEVNHIDGNRANNSYENLEIICPNCHALTPTWKGFNRRRVRSPDV